MYTRAYISMRSVRSENMFSGVREPVIDMRADDVSSDGVRESVIDRSENMFSGVRESVIDMRADDVSSDDVCVC